MKAKKSINITLAIFLGLVLGIFFGLFMPGRYEFLLPAVDLVSGLYMNALRMMIYPLVFCSLLVGIQGIGSVSATGRVGGQCVLYYTATTLFASLLGLFLPKTLGLGTGVTIEMAEANIEAADQFHSGQQKFIASRHKKAKHNAQDKAKQNCSGNAECFF